MAVVRRARPLLILLVALIIYMFTWGQHQTLVFIHSFCACYMQGPPKAGQQRVLKLLELSDELPKIFVPYPIQHAMIYRGKYPGLALEEPWPAGLALAGTWFWLHREDLAPTYMMHRLFHDRRLATNNLSQADLCFPSCDAQPWGKGTGTELSLPVRPGSERKFGGCTRLTLGVETLTSRCSFSVPYWHSIYLPDRLSLFAPWELNTTRGSLLCFAGSRIGREEVLVHLRGNGPGVFVEQASNGTHIVQTWELYARSVFSWQPGGDTETRRGFYDSWMLGCIPVISRSAACTYAGLYGGTLFARPRPALSSIAVVLDDAVMTSGRAMLERLTAIPASDIERRRRRMARLAPLMQWGWSAHGNQADALVEALAVFRRRE
jgi:hypothetical protein